MDDPIHDALAAHDYQPGAQLQTDDRNLVAELAFEGRDAVVKVASEDPTPVARDAAVLRLLRDHDVPVPAVLAAGEGYVVTERRGVAYDGNAPRPRRVARLDAVGRALARLHRDTAFDACGDLAPVGDPTAAAEVELTARERWPVRLRQRAVERAGVHDGGEHEPVADAVLAAVDAHADALRAARDPVLVHGDFEADNLRFAADGDGLAAAVDFEFARAEPGEWDLARAELGWFLNPHSPEAGSDLRGTVRDAYRSVRPLPPGSEGRRALYRAVLALGPLSYVDDVAARAGVDADALAESTVGYVYDCLDAAEVQLG